MALFDNTITTLFQKATGKLNIILPDLIQNMGEEDEIHEYMPLETDLDHYEVRWVQYDNMGGLAQASVLGGQPTVVKRLANTTFGVTPTVFREYIEIGEEEVTKLRRLDEIEAFQEIEQIVAQGTMQLQVRERNVVLYNLWQMLTTGTQNVYSPNGTLAGVNKYDINLTNASTAWTNYTTATPIKDLRAMFATIFGTSSHFGPDTYGKANIISINQLFNNANNNDLAGLRDKYGASVTISLEAVNAMFVGSGLPKIQEYQSSWQNDDANQTKARFLPDNYIVFFGKRPNNQPVGHYKFVRNMVQGMNSGSYFFTRTPDQMPDPIPPRWQLHRGHNGGVTVEYPSAIRVFYTL